MQRGTDVEEKLCKNCQKPSDQPLCRDCVEKLINYYPFDRCPFCGGKLLSPDGFSFICVECYEEISHVNL